MFPCHVFTFSKRLLDLLVYTTNHFIGAIWCLLHLHQLYQRIHLKYNHLSVSLSSLANFSGCTFLPIWLLITLRMRFASHIKLMVQVFTTTFHTKWRGLKCWSHCDDMTGPNKSGAICEVSLIPPPCWARSYEEHSCRWSKQCACWAYSPAKSKVEEIPILQYFTNSMGDSLSSILMSLSMSTTYFPSLAP